MKLIKLSFILLSGVIVSTSYATPSNITLITDPKVLNIPVKENHENLVDLTKQKEIYLGPSPEIPNNKNYTFMRKTVYEKLLNAEKSLPDGIHFCLYEGYRSLELQKILFETQYNANKLRHKDWLLSDVFKETTKLISPVINLDGTNNIPPHSTGGAIDVYLINDKGEPLDLGIHPKDWMEDKDDSLSLTDSLSISITAKKNRKIMSDALIQQGFVNYPTEYWHWSYGDKYWAFMKNQPYAIYDSFLAKNE